MTEMILCDFFYLSYSMQLSDKCCILNSFDRYLTLPFYFIFGDSMTPLQLLILTWSSYFINLTR